MTDWGPAVARARGLSTRALDRSALARLSAPGAALPGLVERGLVPASARDPIAAERALRRGRQDRVDALVRHLGPHAAPLDVALLDEDRRAVLALLRGLNTDPARTLAGLVPTPRLPEPILATLAMRPTPRALGALLAALGHPLGPAVLEHATAGLPGIEAAIHASFAAHAVRAARRGDAPLRDHVRAVIDDTNALTAVVALARPPHLRDRAAYVDGGTVPVGTWVTAVSAPDGDLVRRAHPLGDVVVGPHPALGLLRARVAALVRRSRLEPLSTAPVLLALLRLRAEAIDLRALVWADALAVPPSRAETLWVTP